MDWRQEKKLACMILARTLDRMELNDTSSPRAIQDLDNIIAYLKESTTLLKGKLKSDGPTE
jgi:hypothetical protein